jgi:excisionase family DNA binding protein
MSSNIRVPAICEHCKKKFTTKTTKTRFCSQTCAQIAYDERKRNEKIGKAIEKANAKPIAMPMISYADLKDKELLTIKETCQLLDITDVTLRRWIKVERIITSLLGKKHLIRRSHINELI